MFPGIRDPEPRLPHWFHSSLPNNLPGLRPGRPNLGVMGTVEGGRYFIEQRLLPRCRISDSGKMKFSAMNLGEYRISFKLYFPVAPSHLGNRLIPAICLVALYFSKRLLIHYLH